MIDSVKIQEQPTSSSMQSVPYLSLLCNESLELSSDTETPRVDAGERSYLSGLRTGDVLPAIAAVRQPEINPRMRVRLVDWMMEATAEFYMKRETFHLAVSLVDRFLTQVQVSRGSFQLLGMTALLVAAKAEERRVPQLSIFTQLAENAYSVEQLKTMEKQVLQTLNWRIFVTTANAWLNCLTQHWDQLLANSGLSRGSPEELETLAKTLITYREPNQFAYRRHRLMYQVLDLALLDAHSAAVKTSHLAGAVFFLMTEVFCEETAYQMLGGTPSGETWVQRHMLTGLLHRVLTDVLGSVEDLDLEFMQQFVSFRASVELPPVCQVLNKQSFKDRYEEVLEFQAHNKQNIPFFERHLIQ